MRGGSSRGPFFLASDLPADIQTCDKVLISVMGSSNSLQINGIGGGHPLTSKVAIVSRSDADGVDIDYEFVQVLVESAAVDRKPNCGNMLSGVGPFAIESGLLTATDPETLVRIRNTNTGAVVDVVLQTPGGEVEYEGNAVVDGVPGTAAPIRMLFEDSRGSITGSLLPAGAPVTDLDGVPASLVDGAIPVMILAAKALGLRGDESAEEIDANHALFERVEALRRLAGSRMGLGDVGGQVVPKVALLSRPTRGGTLCVRYLTPDKCHRTLAVTGAVTLVMALFAPGTIANTLVEGLEVIDEVSMEHPEGMFRISVETERAPNGHREIKRLSTIRTARRIFEGSIILPSDVWPSGL
ncbi:hypothetical protein ADU59_09510 [Pararhizobium polonicum]|uniref:4-oxalomesaconate tautomerase n=2 Tax=Pararhizobium polonicum TaxID=1612624 RepID=A0A1C7P2Z0_9HYPH|nr:hypothetical protein ADU59_09510 [Pararhizobium polonicum]